MIPVSRKYLVPFSFFVLLVMAGNIACAQQHSDPRYGPNDTLIVPMIVYQGDTIPSRTLAMVIVGSPMPVAMLLQNPVWQARG